MINLEEAKVVTWNEEESKVAFKTKKTPLPRTWVGHLQRPKSPYFSSLIGPIQGPIRVKLGLLGLGFSNVFGLSRS